MIDVGMHRTEAGLAGDVDFAAAAERAGADHAGARRRRADDDRDAAAQHAAGGEGAGGVMRVRTGEIVAGGRRRRAAGRRRSWTGTRRRAARDRTTRLSAWEAFGVIDLLLAVVIALALALLVLQVVGRGPALPVAIGVLTATLVADRRCCWCSTGSLNQPGPNDVVEVELGAWLGLAALAAVFCGAWKSLSDERPRPGRPAGARARAPPDARRALDWPHGPRSRPGPARRPPRPARAHRGGGRALRRRAVQGARLHRDDRRARATSTTSSRPRTSSRSRTRCAPTSRRRRCRTTSRSPRAPDPAQGGFRVPSPGAGSGA